MMGVFTLIKLVTVKLKGIRYHVSQFPINYQLNDCQESSGTCEVQKQFQQQGEFLFKKKMKLMAKCQSPKVKGNLCNVPIAKIKSDCKSLPRPSDNNGIIVVKLKRKVEPVRRRITESFSYLKLNNHFYRDISKLLWKLYQQGI